MSINRLNSAPHCHCSVLVLEKYSRLCRNEKNEKTKYGYEPLLKHFFLRNVK